MGAFTALQSWLFNSVGTATVAASTAGGTHARLGSLLPLAVGSTQLMSIYPSASSGTALAVPSGTYATSGWTQVLSSGTLSAHMLVAITAATTAGTGEFECQIASGAAGSESLVASIHTDSFGVNRAVLPPIRWPTNERVAARATGSSSGQTITATVSFIVRPI